MTTLKIFKNAVCKNCYNLFIPEENGYWPLDIAVNSDEEAFEVILSEWKAIPSGSLLINKTGDTVPWPQISLHRFYFDSWARAHKSRERYGQAMFNHLCGVRPALAERVRGTSMDPFYCSSPTDPRFDPFISFLERNWFNQD